MLLSDVQRHDDQFDTDDCKTSRIPLLACLIPADPAFYPHPQIVPKAEVGVAVGEHLDHLDSPTG